MNVNSFLEKYHNTFDDNFSKIVCELGGEEKDDVKRSRQAIERGKKVLNILFKRKLWLVLITWDSKAKMIEELQGCGFKIESEDTLIEGKKEDLIVDYNLFNPKGTYYLFYEEINYSMVEKIIIGIINNELGLTPYTGIRLYLVSFLEQPIFLNLYDDRGLEILVSNQDYAERIRSELNEIICD